MDHFDKNQPFLCQKGPFYANFDKNGQFWEGSKSCNL